MRQPSANPTTSAVKVTTSSLKVVHSPSQTEKAITRNIAGAPTVPPPAAYYPASYSKDGPGGNYQGF